VLGYLAISFLLATVIFLGDICEGIDVFHMFLILPFDKKFKCQNIINPNSSKTPHDKPILFNIWRTYSFTVQAHPLLLFYGLLSTE